MRRGWYNEPRRHSLASKGIKTAISKTEAINKAQMTTEAVEWKEGGTKGWEKELSGFTGTENYYKGYLGVTETDGVRYFLANAGWLITDIESVVKYEPKVRKQDFVSVKAVSKDGKAVVTYTDGDNKKLYSQKYEWTDLPAGEYKFFYTNGVLMLANEY